MKNLFLFVLLLSINLTTFSQKKVTFEEAEKLSKELIILDAHLDFPLRIKGKKFTSSKDIAAYSYESKEGDFDFVRAKKGGLDAAFMAVYLPPAIQGKGYSRKMADTIIDIMDLVIKSSPDRFMAAKNSKDIRKAKKKNLVALPLGMENGEGIEGDLSLIKYFKDRGITYITLCHGKDNKICDSSYDNARTWNGLSPFGEEVLKEMQRQGVIIDVSHVSDSAFYQIVNQTKVPVVATHSSCRSFTPGFERNVSDDMIVKIAKTGGLVMINFGSTFLDASVGEYRSKKRELILKELEAKGIAANSPEGIKILRESMTNDPRMYSTTAKVADHIDHVVKLVGINHVGLGSDYDGVGDSLPEGLKDVSGFPNLVKELMERGYAKKDIAKICGENFLNVWDQIQKAGKKMKS
jgi:membrane dipeptidase